MFFLFFFSSRRRHTRFDCDWSSDVCSSDLLPPPARASCRGPAGPSGCAARASPRSSEVGAGIEGAGQAGEVVEPVGRSEEHTSELQSQSNLVCRLLLEKKKKQNTVHKVHPA